MLYGHLQMAAEPRCLPPALPRPPAPPQARHIRRQSEALAIRNQEVQRACEELLALVAGWPRENAGERRLPADAANVFRDYCARAMYQVRGVGRACGWWGLLGEMVWVAAAAALPRMRLPEPAD